MPRPLFRNSPLEQKSQNRLDVSLNIEKPQEMHNDPVVCERAFRRRRSQKYIDAMLKLDAGTGQISQQDLESIINTIKEEFPEIDISCEFFGSMAICHLGEPFEVHTLDPDTQILTHCHQDYQFEPPLDKCRNLSLMPDYLFIEVYTNSFRAISKNGAVAKIPAPGAGDAWRRYSNQPVAEFNGPHEGFL